MGRRWGFESDPNETFYVLDSFGNLGHNKALSRFFAGSWLVPITSWDVEFYYQISCACLCLDSFYQGSCILCSNFVLSKAPKLPNCFSLQTTKVCLWGSPDGRVCWPFMPYLPRNYKGRESFILEQAWRSCKVKSAWRVCPTLSPLCNTWNWIALN